MQNSVNSNLWCNLDDKTRFALFGASPVSISQLHQYNIPVLYSCTGDHMLVCCWIKIQNKTFIQRLQRRNSVSGTPEVSSRCAQCEVLQLSLSVRFREDLLIIHIQRQECLQGQIAVAVSTQAAVWQLRFKPPSCLSAEVSFGLTVTLELLLMGNPC